MFLNALATFAVARDLVVVVIKRSQCRFDACSKRKGFELDSRVAAKLVWV